MGKKKLRLDLLLVKRGLMPDSKQAERLIRAGRISVDGCPADKPGRPVPIDADIILKETSRYVSRGGEKLSGALEYFRLDLAEKTAMDVGSSTGGFTDCLLQAGVRKVYCIDVGKGQLAWKIRQDPRVDAAEGVNARYLTPDSIPELVDIITIDVSFISLTKVLPSCIKLLKPGGYVLALIKPQFEAGRNEVERGGVVRDSRIHERVIAEIINFSSTRGLSVLGVEKSVLTGPAGNKEYFILLHREF